jgi:serine/threonine protein kinase
MTSSLTCPSDEELLAIAAGEEPSSALRDHLDRCAECSERLRRCMAEVLELRRASPIAAASYPGTAEAATDPPTSDGRPVHLGTTEPRESADSTACEPPSSDADDTTNCESAPGDEPPSPAAIGKYLVIGRFPRTGQAEVFRVAHPGLARDLVLKLALRPIEPGGRHEIIDECRILTELKHPNLVQVFDLDFHEDRPYLVMEYIRGRNLDQVAREGHLAHTKAAALLAKVAEAVDFVHRLGITHRDIKPRNILVDEAGEPRLIDFGMARLRHAWSEEPGRPGGTFAFMPPEQAQFDAPEVQEKVGPRSDVFALGAVLYFLLTGKAPFEGESWTGSWGRARRCDFDRRALDHPAVPRELRRICLQAMAADPADRFASAGAFQKALERYLRWPLMRAAMGGAAGLVLLGVLLYQFIPRGTTPPSSAPVSPQFIASNPGLPSVPTAAQPIKGRVNLLVVKSKDGTRRRLRLDDPGAVPVRADDEIRIEARLDRPAYLYLFWLGSEGKVAPLYPWKDHDWSKRPAEERKVSGVELPEILDEVMTIPPSPPGLETLVLLAREDSPLPRDVDTELARDMAGASVSTPDSMTEAIWLENGQEVVFDATLGANRGGDADTPTRSIPSTRVRKSDDPVLRIRAILSHKLQPLGSYSQAVLFPNDGGG